MKAIWNGKVLAESSQTVVVERNHYFPADSVKKEYLMPSATRTVCSWKETASYYTIRVDGESNEDAVWYYPQPTEAAVHTSKDYVAFWKGVQIFE